MKKNLQKSRLARASILPPEQAGPMSGEDWERRLPGLERLWHQTRGDSSITVAVLDGAVDALHPCFAGADLRTVESVVPASPPSRHGTGVASILFGQHGSGVAGLAPGCRGLVVPVFPSNGDHANVCSQIDLARAISMALEHGAQIINVSGGELEPSGEASPVLANVIRDCAAAGVLLVAAAGNDGCECLHVPAAAPSVLAVGAMDDQGVPIDASNWGEAYRSQGILAPGVSIAAAVPGGGISPRTGTSWATPIVSGVAALLLSLQIRQGRRPDTGAVRAALLGTARGCEVEPAADCRRLLAGRLDLAAGTAQVMEEAGGLTAADGSTCEAPTTDEEGPALMAAMETASDEQVPVAVAASGEQEPPICEALTDAQVAAELAGVAAADCPGCAPGPSLVYVLGQLDYDFGSEARRDSLVQHGLADPHDAQAMLGYLAEHPPHATALTFVMARDSTPIYAIMPAGAFAADIYRTLRELMAGQLHHGVDRVSIPGRTEGTARLLNGHTVPLLFPELRGMVGWSTSRLALEVVGKAPRRGKKQKAEFDEKRAEIANFLDRVYYELRNLGLTPQERAMNYAATNALRIENVYSSALKKGLKLAEIDIERSPICRPKSDCWDVKLTFFNPTRLLEQARVVYRFTIDVSDVVPVTVGKVRSWHVC